MHVTNHNQHFIVNIDLEEIWQEHKKRQDKKEIERCKNMILNVNWGNEYDCS